MNHFLLPKKFVRWDRYKCLEQKKEICHHNKFEILSEEIGNEELLIDCVIEKFINTTNSIAKDLSITSSIEIRKAMFRMSWKIYCLQKVKHIIYKQIKRYVSTNDSNEFVETVNSNNRLYMNQIIKNVIKLGKREYLFWIKIGCSLALKKG